MKAFLRWLAKAAGSALTIILVIIFFPFISKLAQSLMPDESGAAIKASAVLSSKLEKSARLETLKVEEEGILHYDIQAAFIGSVADMNVSYRYDASFGLDLSLVTMQINGNEIIFTLPLPELIQDSLTPQEIYRNDFWYPGFSDSDYEKVLEDERLARRSNYLKGENNSILWDASVEAFEKTISSWLSEASIKQLTFSYKQHEPQYPQ